MSPRTGFSSPPRMPLTPAMRPLKSTKMAAARPINTPPAAACHGVNAFQSMVMCLLLGAVEPVQKGQDFQHVRIRNAVENVLALTPCREHAVIAQNAQLL